MSKPAEQQKTTDDDDDDDDKVTTYNGIFDNRQQTNYIGALSQILQYLYFALYFLLLHRLKTNSEISIIYEQLDVRNAYWQQTD